MIQSKIFMIIVILTFMAIQTLFSSQWKEYRITTSPADQMNPDIDGNIVAWEDSRNGNIDIYAADISDLNNPTSFRVSSNSLDEVSPQVSGHKICYTRKEPYTHIPPILYRYEIYMFDIDTGTTTLIADNSIAGTITGADEYSVVWGGQGQLYAYDIPTQSIFPVGQVQFTSSSDVSLNKIVWRNYSSPYYIYGFDMNSWETFPIETGVDWNYSPSISGNIVVWYGSSDIYGADISDIHNVIKFPICTESHSQSGPVISGYNVVWVDNRNGNYDIYGYNLLTQAEFIVTNNSASQTSPAISGNTVVWQDNRHGHYDIYAMVLYGSDVPQCLLKPLGDLNGDCKVDFTDFAILSSHWMECNLNPPSACW